MSNQKHPLITGKARLSAGCPENNSALFWRIGFSVCDSVVLIELPTATGSKSILLLRDIEMERARQTARVDHVACPADYTPAGGLSGDRETATAQAAAECLRQAHVTCVVGDRTLPLIYADFARQAGITVECDPLQWVLERRQKTVQEIEYLRESQQVTGQVMQMACHMIATADVRPDGVLMRDGIPLTSERVRAAVDHWLLDRGFRNPVAIIAGGPAAADCHYTGAGDLRTSEPVIVDIFPQNRTTRYCGDCTRTVVHGDIPDEVKRMHTAVRAAKAAAEKTIAAGVTGEAVHLATIQAMRLAGYAVGLPEAQTPLSYCALTHGTGHGVGLDVHEPPLLDFKGPALMVGEAVTVEPGLYRRDLGGVRIEDLVIVTQHGCENLNPLYDDLCWK